MEFPFQVVAFFEGWSPNCVLIGNGIWKLGSSFENFGIPKVAINFKTESVVAAVHGHNPPVPQAASPAKGANPNSKVYRKGVFTNQQAQLILLHCFQGLTSRDVDCCYMPGVLSMGISDKQGFNVSVPGQNWMI